MVCGRGFFGDAEVLDDLAKAVADGRLALSGQVGKLEDFALILDRVEGYLG